MSKKRYVYFQPNRKDLKDRFGDCQVRALCKALEQIVDEQFLRTIYEGV